MRYGLAWIAGWVGCADPPTPCVTGEAAPPGPRGSVVLIVVDDVGVDKLAAYGVHPRPAPTPSLDAFDATATRFTSAYASPVCSPSRASMLTGRGPETTGITHNLQPHGGGPELPEGLDTIPERLGDGWATAAVGKWHLSSFDADVATEPLRHGFDTFDGILMNPGVALHPDGAARGYTHWERDVDGQLSFSDQYVVSAQADAAIAAVQALPEPFFLYVAFSGVHGPLELPPEALFEAASPVDDAGVGDAMIEALDRELGRLLAAIPPEVAVIVTSDNGTSRELVRPPADPRRAKATVYTGGIHVPLWIRAPGVEPGVSDALVHPTDLFATALDLAGADPSGGDGRSLGPSLRGEPERRARRCVVVDHQIELSDGSYRSQVAALDDGYALIHTQGSPDELYRRDPTAAVEGPDLAAGRMDPEARDAMRRLRGHLP